MYTDAFYYILFLPDLYDLALFLVYKDKFSSLVIRSPVYVTTLNQDRAIMEKRRKKDDEYLRSSMFRVHFKVH